LPKYQGFCSSFIIHHSSFTAMLSRVADALFWMSRYLERAEHTARLLDVCLLVDMDLGGAGGPRELHWTGLAAILQQVVPAHKQSGSSPQSTISHWLTFDLENPNSIMSCISRARYNARGIRGSINSAMWKSLNKLFWQLSDPDFSRYARESPHEFYETVEYGSFLFQGACDATLSEDEGWQFIQLSRYLERIDKTLRILDIQYHLLNEISDPSDHSIMNLHWAGVLRSCRAYEAYQRLYVGRVEPERVVEFLLLHPAFPRSVHFSAEVASRSMAAIAGANPARGQARADRLLGRVLSDLRYAELENLLKGELHAFLTTMIDRCSQVSRAVQEQFR
jgi:uncharacterized alpha-E superfamily protein